MTFEQGRYIAPKEYIDSLKLQYSVQSPEIARIIPLVAAKVISTITNIYHPYIPITTLERLKDLPERIIVTDAKGFDALKDPEETREAGGIYMYEGEYIVLKHPETSGVEIWQKLQDEEKAIKVYGSEEAAKKTLGEVSFVHALVHETIHGFHVDNIGLTEDFVENGVEYYARQIVVQIGYEIDEERSSMIKCKYL